MPWTSPVAGSSAVFHLKHTLQALITDSRPVRMTVVGDEGATFHFNAKIVAAEG